MVKKNCTKLNIEDFRKHPVWQYLWDESDDDGNTMARAVNKLPIEKLTSKNIVGLPVKLANGNLLWASIENISSRSPKATEHFIHLSVEKDGKRFHLGRYFDPEYSISGPEVFAKKLGLSIGEVFPISYDVQPYVRMVSDAHQGQILSVPRERLSDDELDELAGISSDLDYA